MNIHDQASNADPVQENMVLDNSESIAKIRDIMHKKQVNTEIANYILQLGIIDETPAYIACAVKNPDLTLDEFLQKVSTLKNSHKINLNQPLQREWNLAQIYENKKFQYAVCTWMKSLRVVPMGTLESEDDVSYKLSFDEMKQNFDDAYDWYRYILENDHEIQLGDYDHMMAEQIAWHKTFKEKGKHTIFGPIKPGQIVYTYPDGKYKGWTIQKILTKQDFECEGQSMHHCVGSYYRQVDTKNFFSLRNPKNRPHVTIETDLNMSLLQYKMQNNESVTKEMTDLITEGFETAGNPIVGIRLDPDWESRKLFTISDNHKEKELRGLHAVKVLSYNDYIMYSKNCSTSPELEKMNKAKFDSTLDSCTYVVLRNSKGNSQYLFGIHNESQIISNVLWDMSVSMSYAKFKTLKDVLLKISPNIIGLKPDSITEIKKHIVHGFVNKGVQYHIVSSKNPNGYFYSFHEMHEKIPDFVRDVNTLCNKQYFTVYSEDSNNNLNPLLHFIYDICTKRCSLDMVMSFQKDREMFEDNAPKLMFLKPILKKWMRKNYPDVQGLDDHVYTEEIVAPAEDGDNTNIYIIKSYDLFVRLHSFIKRTLLPQCMEQVQDPNYIWMYSRNSVMLSTILFCYDIEHSKFVEAYAVGKNRANDVYASLIQNVILQHIDKYYDHNTLKRNYDFVM